MLREKVDLKNQILNDLNLVLMDFNDLESFKKVIHKSGLLFDGGRLELSEILKTSVPTVVRWEKGETVPHVIVIEAVCKTLLKKIGNS